MRGGGDLATGTIYKLYQCGFRVLVLETEKPSAIRRSASFSEAVYQGTQTIEGVTCILASGVTEAKKLLEEGKLVMLVDKEGVCIEQLHPDVVVDAILAKKNLGTNRRMAPITIGLGPGFEAGRDVDAVIETMRGHSLGKVIYQGKALENTGIPGMVQGYAKERVIYSPCEGYVRSIKKIMDDVKCGEMIAYIERKEGTVPVVSSLQGILRGILRDGYPVTKGMKMADIDPRKEERSNCITISDKARCIAGGVLEAILHFTQLDS